MKVAYWLPALLLSVSAVACAAANSDDSGDSSNSAISSSPDVLISCAAAGTYVADTAADFDQPAESALPDSLKEQFGSYAILHFRAAIVGDVYAVGFGGSNIASLWDKNGKMLAQATPDAPGSLAWFFTDGNPLDCTGTGFKVHFVSLPPAGPNVDGGGCDSGCYIPGAHDGGAHDGGAHDGG